MTSDPTASPPLTSPPWSPPEPSGTQGENCIVLTEDDELRDRACDELNIAVCECDAFADDSIR